MKRRDNPAKAVAEQPAVPPALRDQITKAMNGLSAVTTAHDLTWHLGEAAWSVDQDSGEITFTTPKGMQAIAPVQIIGTYNTEDGTWLWGWDHPSVVPALAEHANTMLEYGRKHGYESLITRKFRCTEQDCWDLTALAFLICKASGAYRGPAGSAMVFMTFGKLRLSISPKSTRKKQQGASRASQSKSAKVTAPQTDQIEKEIRAVVEGFIRDYCIWNNAADKRGYGKKGKDTTRRQYDALIAEYCIPGLKRQGMSYGSISMHAPKCEKIVSIFAKAKTAIVKTSHTNRLSFTSDYEYQLVLSKGKWLLQSLKYVDGRRKYECL